jgi:valyl-tRNA synthetase
MKNRYITWVENLKWDWCISRQRYFGVPFPVWYCSECGKPVFAKPEQLPVNPLETIYEGVCGCGCKEFVPESAVFDTWATSSITPQINERFGLNLVPMNMRTHAHEIIRTWTFYTIVRSLYHTGKLPWKDLMICGYVLAKKGEKISKSKSNNEFDPKYLIDTYSADVLRYWTSGARLGTDTFFSTDELAVSKRFITKLWNASKFAISHLQNIDFNQIPPLMPVDRWIIEKTKESILKSSELLYAYEIGSARHEIDDLFWKDFCDNYIEIVKERLYQPDIHGGCERRSAQYALYFVLLNILKLYSIYIPHITEYIYKAFFKQYEKEKSIHLLKWEKPTDIDEQLIAFGEQLKDVISDMRKYKSENNLSMCAQIDTLDIMSGDFDEWFKATEKDIMACSNAITIRFI